MAKSPTAVEKDAAPYKADAMYDVLFKNKAEIASVKFKAGARYQVRGRMLNAVADAIETAKEIAA